MAIRPIGQVWFGEGLGKRWWEEDEGYNYDSWWFDSRLWWRLYVVVCTMDTVLG